MLIKKLFIRSYAMNPDIIGEEIFTGNRFKLERFFKKFK
jgi:hypothetical protein